MKQAFPIGVFDSGFGGLTVLKEFLKTLPQYDYIYLGDNARAPYGPRSFDVVHKYTLQAVNWLFDKGCRIVILACNTASAKALRTIQQINLPEIDCDRRVLGVIRPVTESAGMYTKNRHLGILGTEGTVNSGSYPIEIKKFFPDIIVTQEACPIWVPLVENHEHESEGADFFVKRHIDHILSADPSIDAIILACTHYPLLIDKILQYTPKHISVVSQGEIVAKSLAGYFKKHPEKEAMCSGNGQRQFYTTDHTASFDRMTSLLFDIPIKVEQISLK
jgi:glutamate racemase